MDFKAKDRRLEGETTLRQTQLTELYLLDVIDEICKMHNIRYFLAYGTLLGCMRHKGFIPWDDDLDIGMPLEDYKKFLKIAPKVLPPNLMLQTPETVPGCFEKFAKIRDLSSLVVEAHSDVTRPCGIFVDIFPFEKYPLVSKSIRQLLSRGLSLTWRNSRLHRVANHRFILGIFVSGVKSLLWIILYDLLRVLLFVLRLVLPTVWHEIPEAGGPAAFSELNDTDLFPLSVGVFEGKEYPIPRDSDKALSIEFGEWRKLPPIEKRIQQHSNIFCPIQTMGFWWTVPHASLSKKEAEGIDRIAFLDLVAEAVEPVRRLVVFGSQLFIPAVFHDSEAFFQKRRHICFHIGFRFFKNHLRDYFSPRE